MDIIIQYMNTCYSHLSLVKVSNTGNFLKHNYLVRLIHEESVVHYNTSYLN